MPNWVKNRIEFECKDKKVLEDFINSISTKGEIDFNKIIPEPKTKKDCNPKYILKPDANIEPNPDKPWLNWYEWNCDNWGCKWNSCYAKTTGNVITFDTPWSPPEPIIDKLAKMCMPLGINFEFLWAEEQLTQYGGFARLNGNDYYSCQYESYSDDLKDVCKELWGYSWEDFN